MLAAVLAYTGYWYLYGSVHVGTDDAYVGGNVVQVTPQIEGTVVAVNADDTRLVHEGDVLVELDAADADVKLASAEAELADAVRSVRGLYANSAQAQAGIAQRVADQRKAQSDLAAAEAEVQKAQAEYRRREALAKENFVSPENVLTAKTTAEAAAAQRDAAHAAVAQTQAAIAAAQQQLRAASGLVDNISLEEHPRVRAAAAKVKEAYLDRERVAIRAPVTGYVAKRSVQVGQRVAPGTPLMAVVPGDQMWVDANFKEGELKDVRIGQPVRLVLRSVRRRCGVPRQGRRTGPGHRQRLLAAARAERQRELDQDRAARTRARRAGPGRVACAPAAHRPVGDAPPSTPRIAPATCLRRSPARDRDTRRRSTPSRPRRLMR